MLVDELRQALPTEQNRIAVEPRHGALEPNAIRQEHRDRNLVLAQVLQECVLECLRVTRAHPHSPEPHSVALQSALLSPQGGPEWERFTPALRFAARGAVDPALVERSGRTAWLSRAYVQDGDRCRR